MNQTEITGVTGTIQVKEDEKAIIVDSFPKWSPSCPMPYLLQSDTDTYLLYYINTECAQESIAIVKFACCLKTQFGSPNDETVRGHRLYNRGIKGTVYAAFEVENSSWISELSKCNSVHPLHDQKRYDSLKHYILFFHDSTFECVTDSFTVEITQVPMKDAVSEVVSRFFN
jgi:hypothetical protein